MDNQHTKITGYRDLTPEEIELVNKVKSFAVEIGSLMAACDKMLVPSNVPGEPSPQMVFLDQRWVSIAKTHFQEGFMALNRAIMKPTTF